MFQIGAKVRLSQRGRDWLARRNPQYGSRTNMFFLGELIVRRSDSWDTWLHVPVGLEIEDNGLFGEDRQLALETTHLELVPNVPGG